MKLTSIVSFCLVLLMLDLSYGAMESATLKVSANKTAEKLSYPKKVSSMKKRPAKNSLKKEADITEKFKDLPADDLEFIKELDKQFKLHGGKVKIKVENENVTETKNSKRTIDGDLGYGYSHNGYEYNPPKFMFYPYSQQNIDENAPKYFLPEEEKTQVSVEPSYSYELKPQTYITHNEPHIDVPQPEVEQQQQQQHHDHYHQQQQPQQQQHYEEPVIVLRIPGPAKYATHLQTLLQQYLEIRAAQYLRILEEAELRKQQQQHEHQPQLQHLDYGHAEAPQGGGGAIEQQHDYQQQVEYDHQIAVTPQPIQYPEIDNVYHGYKQRHPSHPEQVQQPHGEQQDYYAPQHSQQEEDGQQQHQHQQHYQQDYQQEYQHQQEQQEQPQFYYTHQQEYAQPEGPPANTYQHLYLVSMTPQSSHDYEGSPHPHQQQEYQHQPIYVQEQQEEAHHEHGSSLPISENNPRSSHTKVVFNSNGPHDNGDYQMYQLPSIKPNERHAPTSVPNYHQDFQPQEYQQEPQESAKNYQQHDGSTVEAAQPEVVAITQKPHNYHARRGKSSVRGRTGHRRRAASLKQADQGLQKIHDYVTDKLGAQTGSAVEYKTTQVIEG